MQQPSRRRDSFKSLIVIIEALLLTLSQSALYAYIWYTHYAGQMIVPYYRRGHYFVIILYFLTLTFFYRAYGSLRVGYYKRLDSILSQIFSLLSANVLAYLQICLVVYSVVSPVALLAATGIDILIIILLTLTANAVYYHIYPPRQMLLIYGDYSVKEIIGKIAARNDKYEIAAKIHINAGKEKLEKKISKYEAVLFYDIPSALRNDLLKYCFEHSVRVYVTPKLPDIMLRGAEDIHLFDTPFLLMRNNGLQFTQAVAKRCFDILFSLAVLLLSSPLMLLCAAAVWLYDRGPVFYRQSRLTKDGKEFMIYKFRSMVLDAEENGARLSYEQDSRVTPVGKVLRRTHLDELPQLFNIVSGSMSVVGPRPERPDIAEAYKESIPEFDYRLKVKAGLTGYAQVYGKYNTTPYDKLKLDLIYIQTYSFWLDLKLILLTGRILLKPDSTQGVSPNYRTALRQEVAVTKEIPDEEA